MAGASFIFQGLSDVGRGIARGEATRENRLIRQQELEFREKDFKLRQQQVEQNKLLRDEQILDLRDERLNRAAKRETQRNIFQNLNRLITAKPTTETRLIPTEAEPFARFEAQPPEAPFEFGGIETQEFIEEVPDPVIDLDLIPEDIAAASELLQTTRPGRRGRGRAATQRSAAIRDVDDFIKAQVNKQFPKTFSGTKRRRKETTSTEVKQQRSDLQTDLEAQLKRGVVTTREQAGRVPTEPQIFLDQAQPEAVPDVSRFLRQAGVPAERAEVSPVIAEEREVTVPAPVLSREAVLESILSVPGAENLDPQELQRIFDLAGKNLPIQTEKEGLIIADKKANLQQTLLENQLKLRELSGNDPKTIEREVPFFGGLATTKEGAFKVNSLVAEIVPADESLDLLINATDEIGAGGLIFDRAGRAKVTALAETLKGQLRLALIGPGAVSDQERAILSSIISNPADIFRFPSATRASLITLQNAINRNLRATASAFGVDTAEALPVPSAQGRTSTGLSFTVTPVQ